MANSNQALGFINAVAGLKNIAPTINNAVKGIYSRTAKTAGSGGAGGLAYINEVLNHEAVNKGKSQGAKAVKALMLHLHSEGVRIGVMLHDKKEFNDDEIQAAQQAANSFFVSTLQALKDTAAKAKADKGASSETTPNETTSESEGAPVVTDGEALPVVGYDDALKALLIPSDALVVIGESDVLSFGALVSMYNELKAKEAAIIADLVKPIESAPPKGKKSA